MSRTVGGDADDGPLQPIAELFTRSVSALWATTYNIDLALVNEFLLPRLGAPPLNMTVLADGRRLGRTLATIGSAQAEALAAVNCRWLVRGVHPRGPAFHPKSYLAIAGGHVTLLVGSGNLSLGGLDEGREVFTAFRSGTVDGERAIAVWCSWMRRLVAAAGDDLLAQRFADLERRLPAPAGGAPDRDASVLLHNLDEALVDQLAAAVGMPEVDELHLAAPFYDRDAEAVSRLIEAMRPQRITVYLGTHTSVAGQALRHALSGRDVRFRGLDPDEFTHAKIIGVTSGDRGWLITGSANLSRVALLRSAADGNVELAVLSPISAALVRGVFVPPRAVLVEHVPSFVDGLTLTDDDEPGEREVRLLRAEAIDEGRVLVVSDPPAQPHWLLADGSARYPLVIGPAERVTTRSSVAGRLVRLVDRDDRTLSDAVIVEEPAALAAQLGDSGGGRRAAPSGLSDADLATPLGHALERLHRELVMDVAERADATPGAGGGAVVTDDAAGDDFWERLLREQLAGDARASRYAGLAGPRRDRTALDDLLEALQIRLPLGHRCPPQRDSAGPPPAPDEPRYRWTPRSRIRVRARNLLRRWAASLADPRLAWVDPFAPEGNFTALVLCLAELRLAAAANPDGVELTDPDLDDIWWWLLAAFVGTGRRDGHLDRFDPAAADERVAGLDPRVRELSAGLCWLGIRPGPDRRARVIRAQPTLTAAINRGLLAPTEETARFAVAVAGRTCTRAGIEDSLIDAAAFTDDELWCSLTSVQLDLTELRFERVRDPRGIRTVLHVGGMDDPLTDPRAPHLLLAVDRYRDRSGIVVRAAAPGAARSGRASGTADWRLVHVADYPLEYYASREHDPVELDAARLAELSGAGLTLEATLRSPSEDDAQRSRAPVGSGSDSG